MKDDLQEVFSKYWGLIQDIEIFNSNINNAKADVLGRCLITLPQSWEDKRRDLHWQIVSLIGCEKSKTDDILHYLEKYDFNEALLALRNLKM